MKILKKPCLLLLVILNLYFCEKQTIPPGSNLLSYPSNFRAASGLRSIKLFWTPLHYKEIAGYKIYYGADRKTYTDTLFTTSEISRTEITGLEDDKQYFCAISTVDVNSKESDRSDEVSLRTYAAYEDFSHSEGNLDTTKWHYEVGYSVPVIDEMVAAAEVQFNDVLIRRSFGQYLTFTPSDNVIVECEFKLGTPNVGGAGLMVRSERANPDRYYKGYNAFIFWNFNNWELRLEESLVDRSAMPNASPVKLPEIGSDEWIQLSLVYTSGKIHAAVFRLPDYSILGTVVAEDTTGGKRPYQSDTFCGFFTTQYGGNIIYADNFGIRRVD